MANGPLSSLGIGGGGLSSQLKQGQAGDRQPRSGGLSSMINSGNRLKQEEASARQFRQARSQVAATETRGPLGQLTSNPRNLLALLAAGGALAAGQPGAALGVGIGALQKGQQLAGQAEQAKAAQMESLQEAEQQALENADKIRARASNLLVSNPDLFVDEFGNQMDPTELSNLVLGIGDGSVQLNAGSRRALNRRDESFKAGSKVLLDAFEAAPTEAVARQLSTGFLNYHGLNEFAKNNPDVVDALARRDPAAGSLTVAKLFSERPDQAAGAIKYMIGQGMDIQDPTNLQDPNVWAYFKELPKDAPRPSDEAMQRWLKIGDVYGQWAKDNPAADRSAIEGAGDRATGRKNAMELALRDSGNQDLIPVLDDKISVGRVELSPAQMAQQMLKAREDANGLVLQMDALKVMDDPAGQAELQRKHLENTLSTIGQAETEARFSETRALMEAANDKMSQAVGVPVGALPVTIMDMVIKALPANADIKQVQELYDIAVQDWISQNAKE